MNKLTLKGNLNSFCLLCLYLADPVIFLGLKFVPRTLITSAEGFLTQL